MAKDLNIRPDSQLPSYEEVPTLSDIKTGNNISEVHEESTTEWDIRVASAKETKDSYREAIAEQLIKRGKMKAAETVVSSFFRDGLAVASELLKKINNK